MMLVLDARATVREARTVTAEPIHHARPDRDVSWITADGKTLAQEASDSARATAIALAGSAGVSLATVSALVVMWAF